MKYICTFCDYPCFVWQEELVKLYPICHSRMEEIVPKDAPVRWSRPFWTSLLFECLYSFSSTPQQNSFLEILVCSYNPRHADSLWHICSRLVAFNLGYLPRGDKTLITVPRTTELALQAASRILSSGGLISVLVYIGHPGGRDELDVVESFASSLPNDSWVSCKLQMVNRPIAPVLILLNKKWPVLVERHNISS